MLVNTLDTLPVLWASAFNNYVNSLTQQSFDHFPSFKYLSNKISQVLLSLIQFNDSLWQ